MKIPDNYRIINTLSFFNVRLILPVVLLILCFMPLVAHASVGEPWPKTTKACDSIVDRLERLSGYVVDEQMELVSQLYTLGKSNPDVKAIAWRALYWDAVSRHDRKETQHALALIRQAEKSVDRKRFGYDYMRIRRSRMLFELGAKNDLYGLYSAQYADLGYFT